jgi:hypothetical protein
VACPLDLAGLLAPEVGDIIHGVPSLTGLIIEQPLISLFLREDVIKLHEKLNEGKSMAVRGCPGVSKSSNVWAWTLGRVLSGELRERAAGQKKKAMVVVVEKASEMATCVEVESAEGGRAVVVSDVARCAVRDVRQHVELQRYPLVVFDGWRNDCDADPLHVAADDAVQVVMVSSMTITKLPDTVRRHFQGNQRFTLPPWSLDEFSQALRDPSLRAAAWPTVATLRRDDIAELGVLCAKASNDVSVDEVDAVLAHKFHYSGGSARFMLSLDLSIVVEELETAIDQTDKTKHSIKYQVDGNYEFTSKFAARLSYQQQRDAIVALLPKMTASGKGDLFEQAVILALESPTVLLGDLPRGKMTAFFVPHPRSSAFVMQGAEGFCRGLDRLVDGAGWLIPCSDLCPFFDAVHIAPSADCVGKFDVDTVQATRAAKHSANEDGVRLVAAALDGKIARWRHHFVTDRNCDGFKIPDMPSVQGVPEIAADCIKFDWL